MRLLPLRLVPGLVALFAAAAPAAEPLIWHGAVDIAAGRGARGPWRQNDSRYDYVDDPTVAVDDRGEIVVAWVDQARKDVFFRRLSADGTPAPGAPVNVSRNPATFSWLPRIVLAPRAARHVYLLWQEIIFSGGSHGGDILFARSADGGATFAEPVNLSRSVGGDGKGRIDRDVWHNGSLDLAVGDDGALHAAWTEYDGALWVSRSTDGGRTFARPQRIAGYGPTRPARAPALAVAGARRVYLAWTVGDDAAADIRVAASSDGGATFGEARIVARSDGYSDAPKLAVDAHGVLHLVYAESAGGPFARPRIEYTRTADGGRTFDAPREISPREPGAGFPSLGVDAEGNLYVVWEVFPEQRARPRGLGLAVSRDGGRRFTAPVVVPHSRDPAGGSNGSHQGLLMKKLAVSGAGHVVIVNSSLKPNERSRVWLMRGERAR